MVAINWRCMKNLTRCNAICQGMHPRKNAQGNWCHLALAPSIKRLAMWGRIWQGKGGRHVRGAWQGESIPCLWREASGSTHSGPQVRVLFRYALYRKPQNPIYSLSLSQLLSGHIIWTFVSVTAKPLSLTLPSPHSQSNVSRCPILTKQR